MARRSLADRELDRINQAEEELAIRAAQGDREAFDQLFDCYFNRVAWQLRELPELEAQAAIWEALEQIFVGLESAPTQMATRAYRIVRVSHAEATRRISTGR